MIFRLIFITCLLSANTFAAPNIVVSIKPIHSIVSALTQGITTPKLLLKTNQSVHNFHLKPSQLSLMDQADLIISIHPDFEAGLTKALSRIDSGKQFIVDKKNTTNHHGWLDISSIQVFANALTNELIQIDKANTNIYKKNLTTLNNQLDQLKQNITQQLSTYNTTQIAVFSNTFAYFIKSNNLQNPIVITKSHGDRLSILKILKAKKAMKENQTKCLLSTIEIPNKRINVLTEGLDINTASIDITGFNIEQGSRHYFDLMNNITNQVDQCLK
jgi:zinc transport system substrate-binding protein